MRIRSLKPGFFKNEELAELSPWHRLCYAGLWLCADREGRIQDRPKRLKAEIFPYDDLNMDFLLWDLARAGFIVRYQIEGQPLITIPSWSDHQFPRSDEALSVLAPYVNGTERTTSTLDTTTYPAARPIDTVSHLSSDGAVSAQQMGDGGLDLGSGVLGLGTGTCAAHAALSPSATPPRGMRAQDLMDLWNTTTKPPLPKCRELTDDRRRKIRARIAKRPALAEWREAFEAIQADPWYGGGGSRGWIADFDWAIKNDTVIAKVLERVRTPRAAAARNGAWTCPHEPACLKSAWECKRDWDLEQARKARSA